MCNDFVTKWHLFIYFYMLKYKYKMCEMSFKFGTCLKVFNHNSKVKGIQKENVITMYCVVQYFFWYFFNFSRFQNLNVI